MVPTTCEGWPGRAGKFRRPHGRIQPLPAPARAPGTAHPALPTMQILNTLTVLALVVMSFALVVAVPVLYASTDDSGRSNRLILLGGAAWVALVLLNWGMSYFVA